MCTNSSRPPPVGAMKPKPRSAFQVLRVPVSGMCAGLALKSDERLSGRGESGLPAAARFDVFDEHRIGAHPQAAVVVQRTVDDQWLKRFTVSSHANDFVFTALVVPVAAELDFWERGQVAHLERMRGTTADTPRSLQQLGSDVGLKPQLGGLSNPGGDVRRVSWRLARGAGPNKES